MTHDDTIEEAVRRYAERRHEFELFRRGVVDYFDTAPQLRAPPLPCVHSIKSRLKDENHLRDKIRRVLARGDSFATDDLFTKVTDLCGVRVLHLHQRQFDLIDQHIRRKIDDGDWHLVESPKAYAWDPEARGEGVRPKTDHVDPFVQVLSESSWRA